MFFTTAGLVIAWLLFIPSAAGFSLILIAAWTDNLPLLAEMFGSRFLASSNTFAQGLGLSVAFGIAGEISRSIGGMN